MKTSPAVSSKKASVVAPASVPTQPNPPHGSAQVERIKPSHVAFRSRNSRRLGQETRTYKLGSRGGPVYCTRQGK
jgi:hypothetical protein